MKDAKLKPGTPAYSLILDSCARVGHIRKMEDWWEIMLKSEIKADITCYGAVINGYAIGGETELAERALEKMARADFRPDVNLYFGVF